MLPGFLDLECTMDDDEEWCLPVASAVSQPPSPPRGNSNAAARKTPCEKDYLTEEEFCPD